MEALEKVLLRLKRSQKRIIWPTCRTILAATSMNRNPELLTSVLNVLLNRLSY
jgi:hypothetical protein